MLNEHFPTVLQESMDADDAPAPASRLHPDIPYTSQKSVNPLHNSLNLKILEFLEAIKAIALEYPPRNDGKTTYSPCVDDPEMSEVYTQLLHQGRRLNSEVKSLQNQKDKETYEKELEKVGGLLAYDDPEKSPLARYLDPERREAVADQINSAILCLFSPCNNTTYLPPTRSLELSCRITS